MSTVYLLDPSSTLTTHILTRGKASFGTIQNFNTTTSNYLDISGAYSSNTGTSIQIPADTSNNRPNVPVKGYIRYNTSIDAIEFWNGSLWLYLISTTTLTVTGYTLGVDYTITYTDQSNNIVSSPNATGFTIYSFTSTGITGTVTSSSSLNVTYMVIGGGGGGGCGAVGSYYGSGGGAGGYRCDTSYGLIGNQSYNVYVGAGGAYNNTANTTGSTGIGSYFATIIADGGAGGSAGTTAGQSGGSGSGGSTGSGGTTPGLISATSPGGAGNIPGSYTPPEGFRGGNYSNGGQGGPGGSASGAGNDITSTIPGIGASNTLSGGNAVIYATGGQGTPLGPVIRANSGNGGNGGRNNTVEFGTNGSSGFVLLRFPTSPSYVPTIYGRVTGFSLGQYTITYVNSSNTPILYPVSGGYTIYTFLAPTTGTFTPTSTLTASYLVVGGGGGGGFNNGGGGGAGGYFTNYLVSPITLTGGQSYTVQVGAGGVGAYNIGGGVASGNGISGVNSILSGSGITTVTANGGGGGGSEGYVNGLSGGSGGGGAVQGGAAGSSTGGGQGNAGGTGYTGGSPYPAAGGGGAGGAGGSTTGGGNAGGAGGAGLSNAITGVSQFYAGGGGGSLENAVSATPAAGGSGVGGQGEVTAASGSNAIATCGLANTGGGGGGANVLSMGGTGGSGIVVIRFVS